jgi:hypothetical protein
MAKPPPTRGRTAKGATHVRRARSLKPEAIDAAKKQSNRGRTPGIPQPNGKTGGRVAGTPNKNPVPPAPPTPDQVNLNQMIGKIIDAMTPEEFQKLTPLEALNLCFQVSMKAHQFHLIVSMAEKIAPYVHPKAVASVTDAKKEQTWKIEGGMPEPTPPPPPPPSPMAPASTTIQ